VYSPPWPLSDPTVQRIVCGDDGETSVIRFFAEKYRGSTKEHEVELNE